MQHFTPIHPDILVTGTVTQGWGVELSDEILPRIFLNSSYFQEMKGQMQAGHDLGFTTDMFDSANWLLRGIVQRSQTLLRVTAVIVQHQRLYLDNKANNLSPLTLGDIAAELKLHPSTISRATSNKFISAPIGAIPMKTLLTRAVGNLGGEKGHSSQKIKQFILKAIKYENKKTRCQTRTFANFFPKTELESPEEQLQSTGTK